MGNLISNLILPCSATASSRLHRLLTLHPNKRASYAANLTHGLKCSRITEMVSKELHKKMNLQLENLTGEGLGD